MASKINQFKYLNDTVCFDFFSQGKQISIIALLKSFIAISNSCNSDQFKIYFAVYSSTKVSNDSYKISCIKRHVLFYSD